MKIKTSKPNRKNISVQLMDGVIVAFNQEMIGELEDESKIKEIMAKDSSISLIEDHIVESTEEEIHENPLVEGEIPEGEVTTVDVSDVVDVDSTILSTGSDEDQDPESEDKPDENPEYPEIKEGEEEAYNLSDLTVADLQQLCKDAGLKSKDWKELRKPELMAFVKENIE